MKRLAAGLAGGLIAFAAAVAIVLVLFGAVGVLK